MQEAWFNLKYYRAVKSIQSELEEANLRVDWIGRIYTVINLEGDITKQPEVLQQSYVFQQLGPINTILVKYGLSNDAFPEITRLSEESYLIVLYPDNDYFNIYSFIRNVLFAGLVVSAVLLALRFIPSF
jgi:hypothetical protein